LVKLRNKYYKNADIITIQDDNYKKYLNNNNTKVIPNYLSDEFVKDKIKVKKEKRIITISRLEKQKNIPLLINAFANLDKKYNEYKLLIIGSGKEKNRIKKLINNKNLNNRIIIKDNSNNIKEELLSSTIFVLTSNYEGMPNSLLEAMSCSLPVITTNSTEALNNIIDNNKNGIIIDKNKPKELTNKIEYLLDNKNIREKLGKEASTIREKYNKSLIIKEWEQIIKEELN